MHYTEYRVLHFARFAPVLRPTMETDYFQLQSQLEPLYLLRCSKLSHSWKNEFVRQHAPVDLLTYMSFGKTPQNASWDRSVHESQHTTKAVRARSFQRNSYVISMNSREKPQ